MKLRYSILFLMVCALSLSFIKFSYLFTLGMPTAKDVYGGRINYINGYSFHADSTRIFVATQNANSIFYADVLSNSATPLIKNLRW